MSRSSSPCFRFGLLALLTASLSGQNVPGKEDQELARAAKNPFELARFADSHLSIDWNVVWKALGIPPLSSPPCGSRPGFSKDERKRCSTELITVLNPDQTILLISGEFAPLDVYLRFMQEKAGIWRFSGELEAYVARRRHEIDRSSGKPFLKISQRGPHGSDVDCELEEWFDLTQPQFEPAFTFPVTGSESRPPYGIGRYISANSTAAGDSINVGVFVQFQGGGNELGTHQYIAVYKRNAGAMQFTFQTGSVETEKRRPITRAEFERLTDLDKGPTNEVLIKYALSGLKRIANGRDSDARDWLSHVLNEAKETPEVRELKALMRNPAPK